MREIDFLLRHKEWFRLHIFGCYPLSEEFIENNLKIIDWIYLSSNEKLQWSEHLIEKFRDHWDWECLSANESLPWRDELIIRFADRWIWNRKENDHGCYLIHNSAIKWSKDIISSYPDKFPGTWLATDTDLLNRYPEILEDFKDILWWDYISGNEYMNWSEELIDKFIPYWNWAILSANEAVKWTGSLKEKYKTRFSPYYYEHGCGEMFINRRRTLLSEPSGYWKNDDNGPMTPEEFDRIIKLYPVDYFSLDKNVPWSEEVIDKYRAEWNWEYLSMNQHIPWTEHLIDKYIDRLDFGTERELHDGTKTNTGGLSVNSALPWSLRLLKKYESKWDWNNLTWSQDIPWSLEILEEFEDKWVWDKMIWNVSMWEKVFYPFLNE